MRSKKAIAIFVSDIHLSHNPPELRKTEPDWYRAMHYPLKQLIAAKRKYRCPIICAGDLFHTWDQPVELVNFAIDNLPEMYTIPGQHDLPNHNITELYRSAFFTLFCTNTIHYPSSYKDPIELADNWEVYLFPFGSELDVEPTPQKHSIAVIHQYNWVKGRGHLKAKREQTVGAHRKEFRKFSLIVSGDNHNPFTVRMPTGRFINCGCFMRRSLTELKYKPSYWVLFSDGSIARHKLATKHEHVLKKRNKTVNDNIQDMNQEFSEFVKTLGEAGESAFNVVLTLKRMVKELEETKPSVAKHIKDAMKVTD